MVEGADVGMIPKFTEVPIQNTASWTWDMQNTHTWYDPTTVVRWIDNGNRKERRRKAALARRRRG